MNKIIYFSYVFSVFTFAYFFPKMKLDSTNVILFVISISLNIVSIGILRNKKSIIKKEWYYTKLLLNIFFISLFSYILFMLYQLKYG